MEYPHLVQWGKKYSFFVVQEGSTHASVNSSVSWCGTSFIFFHPLYQITVGNKGGGCSEREDGNVYYAGLRGSFFFFLSLWKNYCGNHRKN